MGDGNTVWLTESAAGGGEILFRPARLALAPESSPAPTGTRWGRVAVLAVVVIAVAGLVPVGRALTSSHRGGSGAGVGPGAVPVVFEANVGQADPDVLYLARAGDSTLFLTESGAVQTGPDGGLTMQFARAVPHPAVAPSRPLEGVVNYLLGDDPSRWQTAVATSEGVTYTGLYPGIDLTWYGAGSDFEYDFVVAPGADPSDIGITFDGTRGLSVDDDGDLLVDMGDGHVRRHRAPAVFQGGEDGVARTAVDGRYTISGTTMGFALGDYDPSRPLVIDPVVYSTILGPTTSAGGTSQALAVANDVIGGDPTAFITGSILVFRPPGAPRTTDFPTSLLGYQRTAPGTGTGHVAFVTKLNPHQSGANSLVYSTFLGGLGDGLDNSTIGRGIAVDGAGAAYVTGQTSSDTFPIVNGAQKVRSAGPVGDTDAFLVKLDNSGTRVLYSSYLGGKDGEDVGNAVAVDRKGGAWITGETKSKRFKTVNARQQRSYDNPKSETPLSDAFVARFDTTQKAGASLRYSTYLGGTNIDAGQGIAVDKAGNAYIGGLTHSSNLFGGILSAIQENYAGAWDGFVTVLSPDGRRQLWGTYLGNVNADRIRALTIDGAGNVYVAGSTDSMPGTPGAYQVLNPGPVDERKRTYARPVGGDPPILYSEEQLHDFADGFAAKISAGGKSLQWLTHFGGEGFDSALGIAIDGAKNVFITGLTLSSGLPMVGAEQPVIGSVGQSDGYLAKFSPDGRRLLHSTYLGSASRVAGDQGNAITVAQNGNAYVVGVAGPRFPTTPGALQRSGPNVAEAFFTVLGD